MKQKEKQIAFPVLKYVKRVPIILSNYYYSDVEELIYFSRRKEKTPSFSLSNKS